MIERRLAFYRWRPTAEDQAVSLAEISRCIRALPDSDWVLSSAGLLVAVTIDTPGSGNRPLRLRIFRLRENDDRPHAMRVDRSTVPVRIGRDDKIAEWMHVVIWPDGYAGCDPHRDAPTLNRLADYLSANCDADVNFRPLYDRTVFERLQQLVEYRMVSFRFTRSAGSQLAHDRRLRLFRRILAVDAGSEQVTIEARISAGRSRDAHLDPRIADEAQLLAAEAAEQHLEQLVIRGRTADNRTDTIDMLRERVAVTTSLPRLSSSVRIPRAEATYEAIIAARRRLEDDGRLDTATEAAPG